MCDLENRVRARSRSLEIDIASYWSKIAIFYTPPVFSAPAGDDTVGISRRYLMLIKLE